MKKVYSFRKGFTLVEVLLSIVILSILLCGAISMYFYSGEIQSMATHKKIAAELANSKMEEIKREGYNKLAPSSDEIKIGNLTAQQTVTIENQGSYKVVKVNVVWNAAGKSEARNLELVTYMVSDHE